MAAPVVTANGNNNSKAAGTTLAVTVTSTSHSLNDVVAVDFVMDPSTGTVSFATSGTATVGSFNTIHDTSTGSGTSGIRAVRAWARVTAAGTVTTVTVTLPSATAKVAQVYKITGTDTGAPVMATSATATATPPNALQDLAVHTVVGYESAVGGVVAWTTPSGWTSQFAQTATVGSTGGGGATNTSLASSSYSRTTAPASAVGGSASPAGTITYTTLWQNTIVAVSPAAPGSVTATAQTPTVVLVGWARETTGNPPSTYEIVRGTDDITFGTSVVSGLSNTTVSYTDTTASPGTTYYYKVIASNASGSATSTSATATTAAETAASNSAEGGTSGNAVPTGTVAGSGTAWNTIGTSATCTVTYDNTRAAHGTLSHKILLGATAGEAYTQWTTAFTPSAATGPLYVRMYCYFTANPATATNVMRFLNGTTLRGLVQITTAGKISLLDSAGTSQAVSISSIPLNAWFRLEVSITGSATAGQILGRLYTSMDSATVTEPFSTASNISTGGTIDRVRLGHSGAGVANVTYWVDDLATSDATWVGPIRQVVRVGVNGTPVSNTTTVSSATVNMPTGLSVGNLVVMAVNAQPSSSPAVTIATPSGWTAGPTITDSTLDTTALFYRLYQTGDPSTVTVSWSGNTAAYGAAAVAYENVNQTTPLGTAVTNAEPANTLNPTLPSLTTVGNLSRALAVLGLGSNSATITAEPTGYTLNNQGGVSADVGGKRVHVSDDDVPTPTTTGALTWTTSATGRGNALHVEIFSSTYTPTVSGTTPIRRVGKFVF